MLSSEPSHTYAYVYTHLPTHMQTQELTSYISIAKRNAAKLKGEAYPTVL